MTVHDPTCHAQQEHDSISRSGKRSHHSHSKQMYRFIAIFELPNKPAVDNISYEWQAGLYFSGLIQFVMKYFHSRYPSKQ